MNDMNPPDHEVLNSIYERLQGQTCAINRLGYMDTLQQVLNFEILTAIGIPPTATVLDVGCGRGDLYAYLLAHGYEGHYVGLDLMPHFVEEARRRFPGASFVLGDIVSEELEPCDYALASAIFDYRTPNSLERWQRAIERMFALAGRAIAWNGLTAVRKEWDKLWAQPLPAVIDLCASLSQYYSIRCDYDPIHFTAYLYQREHFYSDSLLELIGYLYLHPEYAQELQDDPLGCARQFGVSLQQLGVVESLWAS